LLLGHRPIRPTQRPIKLRRLPPIFARWLHNRFQPAEIKPRAPSGSWLPADFRVAPGITTPTLGLLDRSKKPSWGPCPLPPFPWWCAPCLLRGGRSAING
jgi:hypothetical protein